MKKLDLYLDLNWKKTTIAFFMFGFSLLFSAQSHGQNRYSLGFEYGDADDGISVVQLNFNKDVSGWFDERVLNLGSRGITTEFVLTALSLNHENNNIFGSSAGLKFDYEIPFLKARRLKPYIEYGLGTALISDTVIGDRDLSTNFHFKNQLGLGLKMKWGEFFVRASHLSNASLVQPNDGIDIISAGVMLTY